MSGRMSMEQAKAIKAKREFAQELEDVKDFEKKVVGRSESRSSRKKLGSGRKNVESSDEDEDEDDDEEDGKPRKKRIVCGFRIFQILWLPLTGFPPRRTLETASVLSSRIKATRIRSVVRVKDDEANGTRSIFPNFPDSVDEKPEVDATDVSFVNAFDVLDNDS